jgi:hypothetical protein
LIAAANGVSRPGIIGKKNDSLAARTTGLFQWNSYEVVSLFPQPEGKTCSKRTVDDVARLGILRNL